MGVAAAIIDDDGDKEKEEFDYLSMMLNKVKHEDGYDLSKFRVLYKSKNINLELKKEMDKNREQEAKRKQDTLNSSKSQKNAQ